MRLLLVLELGARLLQVALLLVEQRRRREAALPHLVRVRLRLRVRVREAALPHLASPLG